MTQLEICEGCEHHVFNVRVLGVHWCYWQELGCRTVDLNENKIPGYCIRQMEHELLVEYEKDKDM